MDERHVALILSPLLRNAEREKNGGGRRHAATGVSAF